MGTDRIDPDIDLIVDLGYFLASSDRPTKTLIPALLLDEVSASTGKDLADCREIVWGLICAVTLKADRSTNVHLLAAKHLLALVEYSLDECGRIVPDVNLTMSEILALSDEVARVMKRWSPGMEPNTSQRRVLSAIAGGYQGRDSTFLSPRRISSKSKGNRVVSAALLAAFRDELPKRQDPVLVVRESISDSDQAHNPEPNLEPLVPEGQPSPRVIDASFTLVKLGNVGPQGRQENLREARHQHDSRSPAGLLVMSVLTFLLVMAMVLGSRLLPERSKSLPGQDAGASVGRATQSAPVKMPAGYPATNSMRATAPGTGACPAMPRVTSPASTSAALDVWVRRRTGGSCWTRSLDLGSAPVDLEYQVHYINADVPQQDEVILKLALPKAATLMSNATWLARQTEPAGIKIEGDDLLREGLSIGSFKRGADAWLTFAVHAPTPSSLSCGANALRTLVTASPQTADHISGYVDTSLTRGCSMESELEGSATSGDPCDASVTASPKATNAVVLSTEQEGDSCGWAAFLDEVTPRSTVKFKVAYTNITTEAQPKVAVRANLPEGFKLIPGTTWLYNSNNPTGTLYDSDGITDSGIVIGGYNAGANAFLTFTAALEGDLMFDCGETSREVSVEAGPVSLMSHRSTVQVTALRRC